MPFIWSLEKKKCQDAILDHKLKERVLAIVEVTDLKHLSCHMDHHEQVFCLFVFK